MRLAGPAETTGAVTARHFCAASYGPKGNERDAIVHQDVALPAPVAEGLKRALGGVINANRATIEKEGRKARAAADLVAETRNEFDDKPDGKQGDAGAKQQRPT